MSTNPTVALGGAFDDLWSGDDTVIDERRTVRTDGERCYCPSDCNCRRADIGRTNYCGCRNHGVRADGELVGQLRLPDEFLPVPAGEMFP